MDAEEISGDEAPAEKGQDEFEAARGKAASSLDEAQPSSGGELPRAQDELPRGEQAVLPTQERLDAKRVIEAALFLSNKPLAYAELALISKTSVKRARDIVSRLAEEYSSRESSVELVCDAQQATMQVKGEFLSPVARLSKNVELSRKATKILALVAKKGKLLQSELRKYFRGDIYSYISELKELGYLSSEKKGNTRVLKPTEKFKESFQLSGVVEQEAGPQEQKKEGPPAAGEEASQAAEVA